MPLKTASPIASFLASSDSATARAAVGSGNGWTNTGRFLRALAIGRRDLHVLIVSDSTGVGATRWPYLWAQAMAARFPTHTWVFRNYNVTNVNYDAAITLNTGTGSRTITIWDAAISGQDTQFYLGTRWESTIRDIGGAPELVIINHGHNEPAQLANTLPQIAPIWRGRMCALGDWINLHYPSAAITLLTQNPGVTNQVDQLARAVEYERLAGVKGWGVIDTATPTMAAGAAGLTDPDGIHPTPAGSQLQADVATEAFNGPGSDYDLSRPSPGGLFRVSQQLLPNGSFASWDAGNSKPTGVTLVNCTAAKDVRGGYFDSPNGYGVRFVAASAAASSFYMDIPIGNLGVGLQNRPVSVFVLARANDASGTALRVQINDGVSSSVPVASTPRNRMFPTCVAGYVPDKAAAYLRVTVHLDAAAVATADITVSSIHVVYGDLPHCGL